MPVNTLSFAQVSTVLNSIMHQATGQSAIAINNTGDFVSVAQTTLLAGADTVLNAINQTLTRTIFSIRPYRAKFAGLEMTESAWGNMIRKLSIADQDFREDDAYKWPVGYDAGQTPPSGNGQSVDPYVIAKPDILQTNFYGSSVYENAYTVTDYQLRQAFSGPEELGSFLSLIVSNRSDKLEQARENMARGTLANLIGAVIAENNSDRIVHLLTEYNTATGLALTAQTVYQPANFPAFMRWVYARIAALSALMTERSEMFQTVVSSKHIMRHTPYEDQRVYLYAPARYNSEMMALADTYHDNYLTMAVNETVNFWQSIKTPEHIKVTASYTDTAGALASGSVDTQTADTPIFGIIHDREAAGYAVTQMSSEPARNGRGKYTTYWDHATLRCFNDNTEKAVVLLLD